jgi:DNA-binding response OmpR family regulator
MANILLVEDEPEVLEANRKALNDAGYRVWAADTLAGAEGLMARGKPDLILLDIILPDGSGVDFCRRIREQTFAPILFLTCLGEEDQVVEGLSSGGDDYIIKPYGMNELLARVRAHLEHSARLWRGTENKRYTYGPLTMDMLKQQVSLDGKPIDLTAKEFALLLMLVRRQGEAVTSDELYDGVWGASNCMDKRVVYAHISALRRKISPVTVTGRYDGGYILEV